MIAITKELKEKFDGAMLNRKFKKRNKFLEYLLEEDSKKQ